ncbi:TolC family protein [Pontibacter ruber]|uniref:TolC family protein n=1 Tax=Pontibacter ruber TaxID=1343895 RepID=A0ABW5CTX8_9BACT|nr:TolC family protein [Pontibacter ruber]
MSIPTYIRPIVLGFLLWPSLLLAQSKERVLPDSLTLEQCIEYAISNKPDVKQARIDEAIGERDIKASLSDWLPQVSARYTLLHNIKQQTTVFGDNVVTIGTKHNSNILFEANQTLYSNDVLLASRSAKYNRLQLDQNTQDVKINAVVDVSKAFFDILLTQEQLRIYDENIAREEKQYKDAFARFESGLVDKTDYQRASITLANSRSQRRGTEESLKAKYTYLKELMGFPANAKLQLVFNNALMQQQIQIDTTQQVAYANRVEYQQLEAQQHVLKLNTNYYRYGFLPTVNAFINYSPVYFNNNFSDLYNTAYPTSTVGLQASIPIFQGTRRIQNLKRAQLLEERLVISMEDTRNRINTEYQTALANYKSDLVEWETQRENAKLAEEVYDVIKLQYDEGVKAYVDLIVAETSLRAAQLIYYNALYRVLASKLDLQRALGTIEVQ